MGTGTESPTPNFPLPWSHYVVLLGKRRSPDALDFYHAEALRNGWLVRQLQRQIGSLFYERTLSSRTKGAMLRKKGTPRPGDAVTADEEVRDALAHYALEGSRRKVLAREYRLALPDEARLREELQKTRRRLEGREPEGGHPPDRTRSALRITRLGKR